MVVNVGPGPGMRAARAVELAARLTARDYVKPGPPRRDELA